MKNTMFFEPSFRFNPLNDFLFLKVFGQKGDEKQLLGFLNAVLGHSGKKPISTVDIVENKTFLADIKNGKSCALDVRAVLENGTKINIEVQLRNEQNIDRRSLFYWKLNYSETIKVGQDYNELPDVININIVDFDYPPKGDIHTCFNLRESKNPSIILSSALEIHFINMVKWRRLKNRDIVNNPLHRWLTWLDTRSPPELIKEVLNMDSAIMEANERQDFVTQNDEDYYHYWRRQMAIMDYNSGMNWAERKGKMEVARNFLKMGIPIEQISEGTGLSIEEVEKLS